MAQTEMWDRIKKGWKERQLTMCSSRSSTDPTLLTLVKDLRPFDTRSCGGKQREFEVGWQVFAGADWQNLKRERPKGRR
jgi:hypothetical protein